MIPCQHLTKNNMTYFQHAKRAIFFAGWSWMMAVVCCVHAVFPWFFTETFSDSIIKLACKLKEERAQYNEKF